VAIFALLAAGVLVASDGVTPELIPARLRGMSIATLSLFALIALYPAVNEVLRGQARDAVRRRDIDGARAAAMMAAQWMPVDGDAPYLLAKLSQTTAERDGLLKIAVENAPSTRNQRALATNFAQGGDRTSAVAVLDAALRRDPNNLLTLKLLLQIQRDAQDTDAAKQTAERLVAVEATDYYKVRSLPEIVPTETAEAREFLATQTDAATEQTALLKPALDIYQEYLARTWPLVDRATRAEPNANLGDENRPVALQRLGNGQRIAERLAEIYRASGDAPAAGEAATAAAAFRDALVK
jgi:tetratricopeptide (TPR) repeat protein